MQYQIAVYNLLATYTKTNKIELLAVGFKNLQLQQTILKRESLSSEQRP